MKLSAIILISMAVALSARGNGGDWCEAFPRDPGAIPVDRLPWLQSLRFGGYIHLQAARVDGRAANRDFSYGRALEVRRTRLTTMGKAFDALSWSVHANVSEDEGGRGGGVEFDYIGLFSAHTTLDLNALWPGSGLDTFAVSYGKRKLTELNEEDETSVNSILTVERSSFSTFLVPFPDGGGTTGAWLRMGRGRNLVTLGAFTTDSSPEFGAWDEGSLLVGSWEIDLSGALGVEDARLSLGGGLQDVEGQEEAYSPWEWVFTPWFRMREGPWELRFSGAFGELEGHAAATGGRFAGASLMPSYWLIGDRLQFVCRYAVMSSEAPQGLRMASRYAREAGGAANEGIPSLAAGRGDFHQSIYAGFVAWPCPERISVLGGVEWERMGSGSVNVYRGTTFWFSTRFVF